MRSNFTKHNNTQECNGDESVEATYYILAWPTTYNLSMLFLDVFSLISTVNDLDEKEYRYEIMNRVQYEGIKNTMNRIRISYLNIYIFTSNDI